MSIRASASRVDASSDKRSIPSRIEVARASLRYLVLSSSATTYTNTPEAIR